MIVSDFLIKSSSLFNIDLEIKKSSKQFIDNNSRVITSDHESNLFVQNAISKKLFFLVEGQAELYNESKNELLACINESCTPLGISGLNPPGRYLSSIRLTKKSKYIEIPLSKFFDLILSDPKLGAKIFSFIVASSSRVIWNYRNLTPTISKISNKSNGKSYTTDRNIFLRLKDSPVFSQFSNESIEDILEVSEVFLYHKNQIVCNENNISDGIYILFSGSVDVEFSFKSSNKILKRNRTIVRPGVVLSFSNGLSEIPFHYKVNANRDTSLLKISNQSLVYLIENKSILASTILQKLLWHIELHQQSVSELINNSQTDIFTLLDNLLNYNSSRIPIDSLLYTAVNSINNRFTRNNAIDCIYKAMMKGNDAERSVAGIIIDLLDGVKRENRFFIQLNKIYKRVVSASPNSKSSTLLKLSNDDFSRAFDQVPFVIEGIENLPNDPRNIYIYNHLAAFSNNELANGHAFSIDSHFISAKILYPKYKDGGQRIVRASRDTEFWRSGYYSRLDNIVVHNPESDILHETDLEKKLRKEKFFQDAQKTFDSKRPLAIAPEGTSETPDNFTETSPGPFKTGAFQLAALLDPEPLIIPIALANFDKPVSNTIYSAVIKPGFKIFDYVSNPNNKEMLNEFLLDFRKIFRGYVEEAINNAKNENLIDIGKNSKKFFTNYNITSPVEDEFDADVFEVELKINEQEKKKKKVILYGSSTFRLWDDASTDLSLSNLINLGFGGATLEACRVYFNRLIVNENPDIIILYAGDNDIGNGSSIRDVVNQFDLFVDQMSENLPNTKGFFISIKPSPFRRNKLSIIKKTNSKIKKIISNNSNWEYIDIFNYMITSDGEPSELFYQNDMLHLNKVGYGLLTKSIKEQL